ncbi:MAG: HEPN domain-containing protein [Desulfurococcales archaeon]|nr:HEPN domain-containing protein [Desulfurococcales archaeon]
MKEVCEWLRRAEKDLRAAEVLLREELYEEAAFHAQQAAEKALKALLVARRVRPPKTHSIEHLLSLLAGQEDVKPFYDIDADTLTDYAVEARYPGPPVVPEEAEQALETARKTVELAKERLGAAGIKCR